MSAFKTTANLKISGRLLPFKVVESEEHLYRKAADLINSRMASLQNQYGNKAKADELQSVITVEAVVDALKAHENYSKLKQLLNQKVDEIAQKVAL